MGRVRLEKARLTRRAPYNLRMLKGGFFALQTPADLLKKLQHDLERLKANPIDTYVAFDFVVTGTHLHEWAWKNGIKNRPTEPLHELVFTLCGALGNGAKHFEMRRRRPPGHDIRQGAFAPDAFAGAAFDIGDLIVHLDLTEATVYGAPSMTILDLAAMVLGYWEAIIPA